MNEPALKAAPEKKEPTYSSRGEGSIAITGDEFDAFLDERLPLDEDLVDNFHVQYGPPLVDEDGHIEVNFAWSSGAEPSEWSEKPQAIKDWHELRARNEPPTKSQLMKAGAQAVEYWNAAQEGKGGGNADKLKAAMKLLEKLTKAT